MNRRGFFGWFGKGTVAAVLAPSLQAEAAKEVAPVAEAVGPAVLPEAAVEAPIMYNAASTAAWAYVTGFTCVPGATWLDRPTRVNLLARGGHE